MIRAPLGLFSDVGQVEAAVAAAIATVSVVPRGQVIDDPAGDEAIDHRQGSGDAALHVSDGPSLAAVAGAPARHLEFAVAVVSAPVAPTGDEVEVHVDAELVVVFWYRLRSLTRRLDRRAAAALAADILRTCYAGTSETAGISLVPTNAWTPRAPEGEWLPVELRFVASFDLTV